MTDTAQGTSPAETEVVSRSEAIDLAADAFKVSLGQIEAPARERDDKGRFVSQTSEEVSEEEIEAEAEESEAAESQDEGEDGEEAAEEAQPSEIDLPTSWPAEQAEMWKALPPEAQAFIAEREGQRDAAVNAKFQEAANLKKANEAIIGEAHTNRQRYAEAVEQVLSLVVPQMPPRSLLDPASSDYDPDTYHYQRAVYEDTKAYLDQHKAQLASARAQEQIEQVQAINATTKDAFLKDVPDAGDQAKAPQVFTSLIEYAVSQGAPVEMYQTPTSALEWHVLWKAQQYDRLQEAKGRVAEAPKPEPKKAQPAVRPGVATPPSARKAAAKQRDFDRLARSGSIADGAAVFKHFISG